MSEGARERPLIAGETVVEGALARSLRVHAERYARRWILGSGGAWPGFECDL